MSRREYELDEHDLVVDTVRNSHVSHFFVEFLQQGGPKPHVVLRLNINPVKVAGRNWQGCRLSMDLAGAADGVFHITPLPYHDTSHAAHASFGFGVKKPEWKIEDYISAISRPDLTQFEFTGGIYQPGSRIEFKAGCGDFITQFFISLHRWGVVEWNVLEVELGTFDGTNLRVDAGRTGFHEIICYNYKNNPTGSGPTIVEYLPIIPGKFLDTTFTRIVNYESCVLPYKLQEGGTSTQPGATSSYTLPATSTQPGANVSYTLPATSSYTTQPIAVEGGWSEWVWDEGRKKSYRGRQKADGEWKYEWEDEPPQNAETATATSYWIASKGISWSVIKEDIAIYLDGATVQESRHDDGTPGYQIEVPTSVENPELRDMVADLMADTSAWQEEGGQKYKNSKTHKSRDHYGGTFRAPSKVYLEG